MIPSGAAHTDMILHGDTVAGTMDDEAKALVWRWGLRTEMMKIKHRAEERHVLTVIGRQRGGHSRQDRRAVHRARL